MLKFDEGSKAIMSSLIRNNLCHANILLLLKLSLDGID